MAAPQLRTLATFIFASFTAGTFAAESPGSIRVAIQNEVTFLGSQQAPVSPDLNPVYYQLLTAGYLTFGKSVAGDESPDREALLQHLIAALRPHGYLPADGTHLPRVALAVTWGNNFGPAALNFRFSPGDNKPSWERPNNSVRATTNSGPGMDGGISTPPPNSRPARSAKEKPTSLT